MTLTEFLLARVDEDAAAARAAGPWLRAPDGHNDDVLWSVAGRQAKPFLAQYAVGVHFDHIARHGPQRVLDDWTAKRQIIHWHSDRGDEICEECASEMPCPTLRAIARPYCGHADYRDEWWV